MKIFTRKEPVYEYEFIYNGEKMTADRCDSLFCIKDERTYENVQWTRQVVGYEDVDYTPLVLPILLVFGFIVLSLLVDILISKFWVINEKIKKFLNKLRSETTLCIIIVFIFSLIFSLAEGTSLWLTYLIIKEV